MSSSASSADSKRFVKKRQQRHQLLPNCQVASVESNPVQLHVTDEDKEMFGEDIQQKLAEVKIDKQCPDYLFVPHPRAPLEVFKEDKEFASDYETIVVEDEAIHVEGLDHMNVHQIEHWEDAEFDSRLLDNIKRAQYTKPRNVQKWALPLILDGYDLTVRSETGSGKTVAYALPIIDWIIIKKRTRTYAAQNYMPYAVILAPTRELVNQCFEQISKFLEGIDEVTIGETYGEANISKCKKDIRHADIICCTPGRFSHFVGKRWIILDLLHFLVFDEGDKFLEDVGEKSFKAEIDNVFNNAYVPEDCQTLFFSATFEPRMREIAKRYLRTAEAAHITNNVMAPTKKCEQQFVNLKLTQRFASLRKYFQDELKDAAKTLPKTFIFCKHRETCEKISIALELGGIKCMPISSFRAQDKREEAFQQFRDNKVSVLVSTDVCARGIDVKDVDLIINFNMPSDYVTYIHRVGRCGRVRHGKCISYVDPHDDASLLKQIYEAMMKDAVPVPASLQELISGEKESTKLPAPKEVDNVAAE